MSALADLLPEENELLVSLPYRAGVAMSRSDDAPGPEDEDRETAALERVIVAVSKMHGKSDFIQDVARQALRQKAYWPRWRRMADSLEPDCRKAVSLLRGFVADDDLSQYRALVLHVAKAVAMSYGEQGALLDKNENLVSSFFEGLAEKLQGAKGSPDNISDSEKAALARLAAALK